MKKKLSFFILLALFSNFYGQNSKSFKIRTIAFYNLENLFDTVNDPEKNDEASPIMKIQENREKIYPDKIDKLSEVILQIGKEKSKTSPAIIGVAEIENKKVLEDLVTSKKLKKERYEIIHFESPDQRGIDVALLYQHRYFKPIYYESFNPNIYDQNKKVFTRDILLVSGYLDDELIHIIVNHWPSRRGGILKTRPFREKAAFKVKRIIEKIKQKELDPKILIMGDFNDNPTDSSFKKILKTRSKKKDVSKGDIYNPYENMFRRGFGTLVHKDKINLFDQIMFTSPLLSKESKDFSNYKMFKSGICNKNFLTQKTGRYKGYPYRSFSKGKYLGGYSDHYPVYVYLIKEK